MILGTSFWEHDEEMGSSGLWAIVSRVFSTAEAKTEAEITQLAESLAQAPVSWRVPTIVIHNCYRNTSRLSVLRCCVVANLTLARMALSLVSANFLHVMIRISCEWVQRRLEIPMSMTLGSDILAPKWN